MKNVWKKFLVVVFAVLGYDGFAQYISVDENYTTDQLVNDVLINNPCGQASNISVSGWQFNSGNTFGYFNANGSSFPFQEGVVLTTGMASSAVGPNNSLLSDGPVSWNGDNDLEQALQLGGTVNATVLEFDFLPTANFFSFNYIFSSEQYLSNPSSNQCGFTDGFAFLLKKANTSEPYQNLAVIPNTNIEVTVNTVRGPGTICPPQNEEYFDAFNGDEHPTNYNGQTKPLIAQAIVEAGVLYHIKIVVADQGNNFYDSAIFLQGGSFKVTKDLGIDRLTSTQNALCPGENLVLNAQDSGATGYKWFKNDVQIPGETTATLNVTDPGKYRVEISYSGSCVSQGEIEVEYWTEPSFQNVVTLVQCDPDNNGISAFNLTQVIPSVAPAGTFGTTTFYNSFSDASLAQDPIVSPNNFDSAAGTDVFARMTYGSDCFVIVTVHLELSYLPPSPQTVTVCDTTGSKDGITDFDLDTEISPLLLTGLPAGLTVSFFADMASALSQTNVLNTAFTNTTANEQVIYARIYSGIACYDIVPVTLQVRSLEPPDFESETLSVCPSRPTTLSVASTFSSYLWSTNETTSQIEVVSAGTYSVTVTDIYGCEATKEFVVTAPEPPVFISAQTSNSQGNQGSITVAFSGNGDYEFSIDGQNFQASPVFNDLSGGSYPIFIRDTGGCFLIGPFPVFLVTYPAYFTPNGDGIHDVWKIDALSSQPDSKVSIFDRYGKLLFQFTGNDFGWDGSFNAAALPSTDYWFVLEIGGSQAVKGHFSLKR